MTVYSKPYLFVSMSFSLLPGIDATFERHLAGCEMIQPIVVSAAGPVVFMQCSEVHPSSECEVVTAF